MIEPGAPVPPVRVWPDPDDGGDGLLLDQLAAEGPFLLLFYLFDWTGT
jgi:hypothetical protein